MNVEQLIERLQDMPPNAQVLVEGAAETFWSVRDVTPDENEVAAILLVGSEVQVLDDATPSGGNTDG